MYYVRESYHEQTIPAEESCEFGCRSKDLPWTNSPGENFDNELTSSHIDIRWEQHRGVGTKSNHVGCNIDSNDLDHPGECAKENGESDTGCPVVVQDKVHHIPLVPASLLDTCYMMRRAFNFLTCAHQMLVPNLRLTAAVDKIPRLAERVTAIGFEICKSILEFDQYDK